MIKLSKWAKNRGVSYRTAYRWYQEGNIDSKVIVTKSGSIFIEDEKEESIDKNIVIYARVSNAEQKDNLNRQIERCKKYAEAKGYQINKIYKEIGSGMNDKRNKLSKMLESNPDIIIIENKDRLTRFGFNYLETLLNKLGCKIEVINRDETEENDLMKDLVSVITSFCCRLYGLRRGYEKSKKIKESLIENSSL